MLFSWTVARPLRIKYDGALYHLTSRGNDRKAIFKNDGDRKLFLDTPAQVIKRFHWICHAYCLMDNHDHLIVETPEPWLDFDQQHVATVASVEGVFQLLDGDKKILRIAGAPNLRQALEEQLGSNTQARYFIYEEAAMCTQRESEPLQHFLQEHGRLPAGNDLGDDLF
jgi:REP element-mobilizing transposase RayT